MKKSEQKNNKFDRVLSSRRYTFINSKYCGKSHVPRKFPAQANDAYNVTW